MSTVPLTPWRVLTHDPDRDDPKWIVATVAAPWDVRPARITDVTPDEVTSGWVASVAGVSRPVLSPPRPPTAISKQQHSTRTDGIC